MTFDEARKLSDFPEAFTPGDTWVIVNTATGKPVESAGNRFRAFHAARGLNECEIENGREAVYEAQALTNMTQMEAIRIARALKDAREALLVPDAFPNARAAFRQNVCAVCKVADVLVDTVTDFNRDEFMQAAGLPPGATASSPWSLLYPQTEDTKE